METGSKKKRTRKEEFPTVLCNFRKLLADNGLGSKIFDLMKEKMDRNGLIMHGGTIMDATIHEAPKSTRNVRQERDPERAKNKGRIRSKTPF